MQNSLSLKFKILLLSTYISFLLSALEEFNLVGIRVTISYFNVVKRSNVPSFLKSSRNWKTNCRLSARVYYDLHLVNTEQLFCVILIYTRAILQQLPMIKLIPSFTSFLQHFCFSFWRIHLPFCLSCRELIPWVESRGLLNILVDVVSRSLDHAVYRQKNKQLARNDSFRLFHHIWGSENVAIESEKECVCEREKCNAILPRPWLGIKILVQCLFYDWLNKENE